MDPTDTLATQLQLHLQLSPSEQNTGSNNTTSSRPVYGPSHEENIVSPLNTSATGKEGAQRLNTDVDAAVQELHAKERSMPRFARTTSSRLFKQASFGNINVKDEINVKPISSSILNDSMDAEATPGRTGRTSTVDTHSRPSSSRSHSPGDASTVMLSPRKNKLAHAGIMTPTLSSELKVRPQLNRENSLSAANLSKLNGTLDVENNAADEMDTSFVTTTSRASARPALQKVLTQSSFKLEDRDAFGNVTLTPSFRSSSDRTGAFPDHDMPTVNIYNPDVKKYDNMGKETIPSSSFRASGHNIEEVLSQRLSNMTPAPTSYRPEDSMSRLEQYNKGELSAASFRSTLDRFKDEKVESPASTKYRPDESLRRMEMYGKGSLASSSFRDLTKRFEVKTEERPDVGVYDPHKSLQRMDTHGKIQVSFKKASGHNVEEALGLDSTYVANPAPNNYDTQKSRESVERRKGDMVSAAFKTTVDRFKPEKSVTENVPLYNPNFDPFNKYNWNNLPKYGSGSSHKRRAAKKTAPGSPVPIASNDGAASLDISTMSAPASSVATPQKARKSATPEEVTPKRIVRLNDEVFDRLYMLSPRSTFSTPRSRLGRTSDRSDGQDFSSSPVTAANETGTWKKTVWEDTCTLERLAKEAELKKKKLGTRSTEGIGMLSSGDSKKRDGKKKKKPSTI